jgi:hypothetical protein
MRERDQGRGHAWGGHGAPGARGPSLAGLGWAGPHRGAKSHGTHNRRSENQFAKQNPKRI